MFVKPNICNEGILLDFFFSFGVKRTQTNIYPRFLSGKAVDGSFEIFGVRVGVDLR